MQIDHAEKFSLGFGLQHLRRRATVQNRNRQTKMRQTFNVGIFAVFDRGVKALAEIHDMRDMDYMMRVERAG
jgi:hypothetical protein